jgi:hypothetical protein
MTHHSDASGLGAGSSQPGDDMSSHSAGPEETYPLNGREDIDDAWAAAASAADPDTARDRIVRVAFNNGWEDALPADARAWINNRGSDALRSPGNDTGSGVAGRTEPDRVVDPEIEALQPDDATTAARHRGQGLGTGTPL